MYTPVCYMNAELGRGEELSIGGAELILLPEKGVWWPAERTLFVADLHLGKDASFRAGSIAVPCGATEMTLERLGNLVEAHLAQRVVILGDLWHNKNARCRHSESVFAHFRERFSGVAFDLVIGNHDVKAGPLPSEHAIGTLEDGAQLGPFQLHHDPSAVQEPYGLAGHLHPGAQLVSRSGRGFCSACCWIRENYAVLPAFGEFTGLARIKPNTCDRVFVIVDDHVREV